MSLIDRLLRGVSPVMALRRARARLALSVIEAHYAAGTSTGRASSWRASGSDADAAAGRRSKLRFVARDMIRNTPLATRAQMVIANNVVGDGIVPKIKGRTKRETEDLTALAKAHFETVSIDADGRSNLYGLQRLVMNAVVDSGEVLIRRRRRNLRSGLPVPMQLQVLEIDYLDTSKQGEVKGGYIVEGIEFDSAGRRVAYWLFDDHPGSARLNLRALTSTRIAASEILHIYRQDRPGQRRGVTWFAPVAMNLQDLADGQDAHLMRQKIAACFAGYITDLESVDATGGGDEMDARFGSITPGRIERLSPGEDIKFPTPPSVDGYDTFTAVILRSVASGLGITYEALSGDLSGVNFSSARIGRMEMYRNISSWQWLLMIPQMMQPISAWFVEAAGFVMGRELEARVTMDWVPPPLMMVDPTKEIAAMRDEVRAGFASRQMQIRRLGYDPDEIRREQIEDRGNAENAGLVFDSDASVPKAGGQIATTSPASNSHTSNGGPTDGQ